MTMNRIDNEYPAFIQGQKAWLANPDASGRLEVRCGLPLKDRISIPKLQGRLDRIADQQLSEDHKLFLGTLLDKEYVDMLDSKQGLPPARAMVRGGDVMVRVDGPLAELPLWEAPIAVHLHDLFYSTLAEEQNLNSDSLVQEGVRRFDVKCDMIRQSGARIIEAGTRWRYGWDWYSLLFMIAIGDIGNLFSGTTNLYMALTHGMKAEPLDGIRVENPSVDELANHWPKVGSDGEAHKEVPLIVTGANAFQIAHLHGHFGKRLAFAWQADLTSDMGPSGFPLPLTFTTR